MGRMLFTLCFLLSSISFAETTAKESAAAKTETAAATATGDKAVNCAGGAGSRKLVIASKDKGCELQYTKSDKTDVIATQKMGGTFCEEKLAAVKTKLEAAGYKCE